MAGEFPAEAVEIEGEVPFSSGRRWSALTLDGRTLRAGCAGAAPARSAGRAGRGGAAQRAARARVRRRRPGRSLADVHAALPAELEPLGVLVLAERLRPDARATVEFFRSQGVELKVLSGDAPETVAAIAADAGIPLTGPPVDGSAAADDPEALEAAREPPSSGGSRRTASAPWSRRCATRGAMWRCSATASTTCRRSRRRGWRSRRAAAPRWPRAWPTSCSCAATSAAVPGMVAEGRQILRNLQRVAKLYVSKSAFAVLLDPDRRHDGHRIPAASRATSASRRASRSASRPSCWRSRPARARGKPAASCGGSSRFAVPAGAAAGIGVVSSYQFALQRARPAACSRRARSRPACSCSSAST